MELLHKRLRDELARVGLSGAQASRDIGLPDSQGLRDVLAGRKRLTAEMLALLTKIGVDATYVLVGQYSNASDPAERVLIDNYRRCAPEAQQHLIQTAALLAAGMNTATPTKARPTTSIKVSSRRGHAAGRDVNITQEGQNGKNH